MSRQNIKLCECCAAFDIRRLLAEADVPINHTAGKAVPKLHPGNPKSFKQHSSLASLRLAAEQCDLCSAIWRYYIHQKSPMEGTEEGISNEIPNGQIYLGTQDWDSNLSHAPQLYVSQEDPRHHSMRQLACFDVCYKRSEKPSKQSHLLYQMQAAAAAEPGCFELAQHWLRECRFNHGQCRGNNVPNTYFPTRVLDVSPDGESESNRVRLVDGVSCDGSYVALSYCWGGDQQIVLRHETELRLRGGIDSLQLSGTLEDAIRVTRQLGIQYIWIDALCIFQDQERQDSKEDWAREASRMRDVYRGAMVTIEAAAATKASEGFLRKRSNSMPYCGLQWGLQASEEIVYLRPIFDISDSQLLSTKIFTRGWTLQERLLAPRTLSFGTQQMSFECCEGFVDEAGRCTTLPRRTESYLSKRAMHELRFDRSYTSMLMRSLSKFLRLPNVVTLFSTVRSQYGWSMQGTVNVPGGYWMTYHDYWRAIIQRFSERELTNSKDRLSALSGLADEFQRTTGDTYVAGMWKEELVFDLGWQCDPLYNPHGEYGSYPGNIPPSNFVRGSYPEAVKSNIYVAPSWSWASVQGRIKFFGQRYYSDRRITYHAKVVKVVTEPKHASDRLGRLQSGILQLSAPLIAIPDPTLPCNPDLEILHLHNRMRQEYIQRGESYTTEFYQHHEPSDGQEFGLIKLFHDNPRNGDVGKLLLLLLIESCPGGFRRLCCFDIQLASLQELEADATKGIKVMSESDKERINDIRPHLAQVAQVTDEVLSAKWIRRTINLL